MAVYTSTTILIIIALSSVILFFFVVLHNSHTFQIVLGELQESCTSSHSSGIFKKSELLLFKKL